MGGLGTRAPHLRPLQHDVTGWQTFKCVASLWLPYIKRERQKQITTSSCADRRTRKRPENVLRLREHPLRQSLHQWEQIWHCSSQESGCQHIRKCQPGCPAQTFCQVWGHQSDGESAQHLRLLSGPWGIRSSIDGFTRTKKGQVLLYRRAVQAVHEIPLSDGRCFWLWLSGLPKSYAPVWMDAKACLAGRDGEWCGSMNPAAPWLGCRGVIESSCHVMSSSSFPVKTKKSRKAGWVRVDGCYSECACEVKDSFVLLKRL